MPIDITEEYIRIRVELPDKFEDDSFRIIWISKADKIKAVAGRLKGKKSLTIQSLLFDKSAWTVAKAKKWVKDHGYTIRATIDGIHCALDDLCLLNFEVPISRQFTATDDGDDSKWELIIEAWASTPDVDRYDTIIPPTAFARTMPIFMENQPIMMFNHSSDWTIGRILDYKINEEGLYIKGGIAPTERGKEVAMLIKYDVVSAMSFQFDVIETERDPDTGKLKFIDVEIYEIGPVSIPGNPQAVIEQARQLGIELQTLTVPSEAKGANPNKKGEPTMGDILTEEKVRMLVDSSVKQATEGITQEAEVHVADVKKQVENLAKLQKDIQEAMSDETKTSGEMRELIQKVQGDFDGAVKQLNEEIAEIKKRKSPPIVTEQFCGYTLKDLVNMEPTKIRTLFPDKAGQILELHKLNDACILKDACLCAKSVDEGTEYHRLPKEKRIRELKEFEEMLRFQRALDTATSTEGAELIPTDFAGTIHELIRAELKVAPLFETFQMPTASFKLPVETADVIATIAAQKTTVATGFDSTEQTPTTSNVTLTAEKLRARIQLSTELIEDSAVPITPWVQSHASRAIARAIDQAIIAGQETADFDTQHGGLAATDARKIWDGLRYHYENNVTSANGVDCGTFNEDNLRKIRQKMGNKGLYFNDLAWLCSVTGYLGRFMKDLDQILTMDKYGPNAVILSGEVMKFDNIPVIVTEFIRDDLDATGKYTSASDDWTQVILVNRRSWIIGNRKETTVSVVPDKLNDISTVVAFWRGDFQPWWTPSTTVVPVNVGYNVSTA